MKVKDIQMQMIYKLFAEWVNDLKIHGYLDIFSDMSVPKTSLNS